MSSQVQSVKRTSRSAAIVSRVKQYAQTLGPGVITGASDDDPSGIGTYSQTGAQFGYAQLWTALFTFPLMASIQEMCARIALQTGGGLAATIRRYYPKPVLYLCVALLFVANTINLGADLGAMAAAGQLLLGIPFIIWLVVITLLTGVLQVFVDYNRYARLLRYLTFSVFAYLLVPFVTRVDWGQALRNTLIPTMAWNGDYWMNLVALLGTTISPYLFFWQANQEIEEEIDQGKTTVRARRGTSRRELRRMRTDVLSGMLLSNVVAWFIIVTTASTLFARGITNVDSATKAAEALRPAAGSLAYVLFAAGIIGTGMLAVPILAGAAAYAVAETFNLEEGLSLNWREAPGFYAVIALAVLIGFAMNLIGINPIQALYYTAVLNGVVAPPLLVMIMLIGNNHQAMKGSTNGRVSNVLGWTTTITMTLAAGALIVSSVLGK